MKKATYKVLFNRRKKLLKDGTAPVEIVIILNSIPKYKKTGIRLKPEYWNSRSRKVKDNHPLCYEYNQMISDQLYRFEKKELDYLNKGKAVSFDIFDEPEEAKTEELFTEFWERLATSDRNIKPQTRKNHLTHLNHLKAFQKKVAFSELTPEFLASYENHLLNYTYIRQGIEHHLKSYALHSIFRSLKAYVNKAVRQGRILNQDNPFKRFDLSRYEKQVPNRKFLDPKKIRLIEGLEFEPHEVELEKIRDAFLLACYTGLSSTDVISLNKEQIKFEEGKGYSIERQRDKNSSWFYIPIYMIFNGKPVNIIEKYFNTDREYLFDEFSNQKFNKFLKVISKRAGITENVTFHMGRHSCAKYLLDLGVRIEVISKILGHVKLSTTMIYATVDKQTIDQEIDKIKF